MKAKLLTLVTLAALVLGGLTFTNTAEARPWRGYYGGYYGVAGPRYYQAYYRPYYAPYRYRSYNYGPGVYFRAGPAFVW